jgi:signal transduction histidine kinase
VIPANLLRTSSFRLTLLYAGLFAVSVLVLFAIVHVATADYMARQLDRVVNAELAFLEEADRIGGNDRLIAVIEQRQLGTPRTGTVYLPQDADGGRLAGNLSPRRATAGWLDFPGRSREAEGEEPHRIRAQGVMLEDGRYLFVGQDANQLDELRALVLQAFGLGAAVTLVLALAGGLVMSARILRRVTAVAGTSQAIMQGDLSQRVPTRGVGDEFDHLAEALNAMLARIQRLMDELKQVSHDIAHDLRTPLSRLRQRLEGAERSNLALEDYRELVDRSIRDIDAILATFASLLRIAEIEAGARRSGFAEVDLGALLRTVIEVYEPAAADRGQSIEQHIASGLVVRGDRDLLAQLFANLLQNAIVHTPHGSRITVDAAAAARSIVVAVADNGPGIPESERAKVFQRFYRMDSSRTTAGSGLGLSLVAAIARLHGIAVALEDNRPGLRVGLRFPA